MIILQDTREKTQFHTNIVDGLTGLGHKVERTKLYVGDYTLPTNQSVCVDVKQNLSEIYGNLVGSQHGRFVRECKRAQESGIRLIILCEQGGIDSVQDVAKWENPRIKTWQRIHNGQLVGKYRGVKISQKPPVSSAQLATAMQTISERYGCEWMFCEPWRTVHVICEVLGID